MKKVLVFMADGFEEIEALTAVDLLRRAGVGVDMWSIGDGLEVTGSHGIRVIADCMISEVADMQEYDALVTPGGIPGSTNLRDCKRVTDALQSFYGNPKKVIGSICASPIVLGKAGVAAHVRGTCYPGYESEVGFREYLRQPVVADQNVVTAPGPAASFLFALKLVELLAGKETAEALSEGTQLNFLREYGDMR